MEQAKRKPDVKTLSAFALLVVLLGVNFVAVRYSNAEMRPFWGSAYRFAVAAAVLVVLTLVRRVPFPRGAALTTAVVYGVLSFGVVYALLYWALLFVASGVTAVVFASVPLSTFAIAVGLRMEPMRLTGLAGALLALAGICVVFAGQLTASIPAWPLVAIALGSVGASASGIIIKRAPKSHPFSTNAVGMAVGAGILMGGSLAFGEPVNFPSRGETWAAFAWLVTSSVVAFSIIIWILGRWPASSLSYQSVLSPLVTITAASALVGEPVTVPLAAGTVLVLAGVYLGTAVGRRPPGPQGRGVGHFEFEMESPLPRDKLFAWYTDFSDRDSELSKKYGSGTLLARQVRRTDDGHIICEQRLKIGRLEIPGQVRVTLHPENFTYDAELDFGNIVHQDRQYIFLEKDGHTMVRVKVDYTPKAWFVKALNAVGLYKRIDLKESRATMDGYFKAAEAELGPR